MIIFKPRTFEPGSVQRRPIIIPGTNVAKFLIKVSQYTTKSISFNTLVSFDSFFNYSEATENCCPNNLSPENGVDPQIAFAASKFMKRKKTRAAKESEEMAVSPSKKNEGRKSNASKTSRDVHKIVSGFRLHLKDALRGVRNRKEKEDDEAFEESLEKEQEEWKSVARTVDKLFFRLYMFLMILSYCGLAIVAIHGNFTIGLDV